MTDRELMQQALEVLELVTELTNHDDAVYAAIDALRERLAQPVQEPAAWEDVLGAIARGWTHDDNKHKPMDVQLAVAIAKEIQDMVSAPPQRKPLTDEEIDAEWRELDGEASPLFKRVIRKFARAIEAKLREKNHG